MNTSNRLLFGTLILLVTVVSAQSLECYVCTGCNDPFSDNGVSTRTCFGSCLKAKGYGTVVRTCSEFDAGDQCAETDDLHSCSCTTDLCNSASGFSITLPVVCITAFIFFLGMF